MTTAVLPDSISDHVDSLDCDDVSLQWDRSEATATWQQVIAGEHTEPLIRHQGAHYAVSSVASQTPEVVPTLLQYGNFIVVDFNEPLAEFPFTIQEAVSYLRNYGRPVAAKQLLAILEDQEPEDEPIRIASLREMAWLLVDEHDLVDPFIGVDRRGLMHAQWRIAGNGVIVWGFLEHGESLLVIRADRVPGRSALKVSTSGPKQHILEKYGRFVPRRPQ